MSGLVKAPTTHCSRCQKWVYLTRADARTYARRWHAGEKMSVYKSCDGNGFHLGHRPKHIAALRARRRRTA